MISIININRNIFRLFWRIMRMFATVLSGIRLDAFMDKSSQNMNAYARWELFIIGCLFLGITLSIDTQLHWLVLLPLFSIYLILSAIIGFEPLYFSIQRVAAYLHNHSLIPKLHSISYGRTSVIR